ncbi:hypothetical protein [Sagittula sp.]|uniref:hypothetical protein n=1 Tax=Sagittula sp. TaxID=2038081 RepID=UPI0035186151
MRRLWREAPYLTAGLALALLVALIFAARLAMGMAYWSDPGHQDQPIAPWMTPRFVAMSWDVPKEVVMETLDLSPDSSGPRRLSDLSEARGVPVEDLIAQLEAAIAAYRASAPDD